MYLGMSCNYSLTERTTWVVRVQGQSLTFESNNFNQQSVNSTNFS